VTLLSIKLQFANDLRKGELELKSVDHMLTPVI